MSEQPESHRSGFVSFVGRPNAGKSTLTNALVGEKVGIVKPGTFPSPTLYQYPVFPYVFGDNPVPTLEDCATNERVPQGERGGGSRIRLLHTLPILPTRGGARATSDR